MLEKSLFQTKNKTVCQTFGLDSKATMNRFIWPSDFSARLRLERSRYVRSKEDAVLFVIAPTGFGKSHLLQAIAHDEIAVSPAQEVVYLKADAWNHKTRRELSASVRDLLEGADVLLLDDAARFNHQELLASILVNRTIALRRTIVSVNSRQDVMKCGLGSFFRQRMVIEFQKLGSHQIKRLIAQRARDCGMSINSRKEQRLASYRYRDVVDVFSAVGESTQGEIRRQQHQRA